MVLNDAPKGAVGFVVQRFGDEFGRNIYGT